MTEIEAKSLKTQLELYRGIVEADSMIIHTVQSTASRLLSDVITPKMKFKPGQETVELNMTEFIAIKSVVSMLSTDGGFCMMNDWIKASYITPKEEKQKILSMLR